MDFSYEANIGQSCLRQVSPALVKTYLQSVEQLFQTLGGRVILPEQERAIRRNMGRASGVGGQVREFEGSLVAGVKRSRGKTVQIESVLT